MAVDRKDLALFVLQHLQQQRENYGLAVQQEHVEDVRGHLFGTVVDEDGLNYGRENWHQTDLDLVHDVVENVRPGRLENALQESQQVNKLGGLHVEAVLPLVLLHQVHETVECVFFAIKMLKQQCDDEVHALAVRNFPVVHGVGI